MHVDFRNVSLGTVLSQTECNAEEYMKACCSRSSTSMSATPLATKGSATQPYEAARSTALFHMAASSPSSLTTSRLYGSTAPISSERAQISTCGMVDIHEDAQTLACLHIKELDGRNTQAMTQRVLHRAHAYSIQHTAVGKWHVLLHMVDGITRVVLPKNQRQAITKHAHASRRNFRACQTTHLLLIIHGWSGILR